MAGFTESLEEKAKKIVGDDESYDRDSSIPSILKNKIALTVDHIERIKDFHQNQNSRFTKTELDIGTEILQLEDRTPRYSPYQYPEREKLQRQLMGVKTEKRKEETFYEDKLQGLHKDLLRLVQKYMQIRNIDDGPRQYSPEA